MSQQGGQVSAPTASRQWWTGPRLVLGALAAVATIVAAVFAGIVFFRPAPPTPYVYSTQVPGPGCDKKGARWVAAAGHADCLADRLQLSTTASEGIGQVFFYGDQHLPTNYKVGVDVDGLSDGACAGVITRNADGRRGGYAYEACSDGNWLIAKYDLADAPYPLTGGKDDHGRAFSLAAISQGISLRFSLNGREVGIQSEGTYTDTDSISLFVTPLPNGASQANFQNFTFTELTA